MQSLLKLVSKSLDEIPSRTQTYPLKFISLEHLGRWHDIRLSIKDRMYASLLNLMPLYGSEMCLLRIGEQKPSVFEHLGLRSIGKMTGKFSQ